MILFSGLVCTSVGYPSQGRPLLLVFVVMCVALMVAIAQLPPTPVVELVVDRDANDPWGMAAIMVAEGLDVAALVHHARFFEFPRGYLNETPTEMHEYIYPNLVDSVVLDYYTSRWEVRKAEGGHAHLHYTAECTHGGSLHIPEDVTVGLANFTVFKWYANLTGLPEVDDGHMLMGVYIVNQTLRCSEYYGPEAAWWGYVEQLVVLNAEGVVRVVLVSEPQHIIS